MVLDVERQRGGRGVAARQVNYKYHIIYNWGEKTAFLTKAFRAGCDMNGNGNWGNIAFHLMDYGTSGVL